jgi:carbonic anhydrase
LLKTAAEALQALQAGNRRFVADIHSGATRTDGGRRAELLQGQEPFAIILGCSDSRVPAEIVFDQGLGALFVIRVAGNVVAPSQIGSVEFAVERFGTRLVVVLGHTNCGAILATLEELELRGDSRATNVGAIVSRIRPCVEPLREVEPPLSRDVLLRAAVRANIRASVNQLRHGSRVLEPAIHAGEVVVVGAEYSLETGVVTWLDMN